MDVGNCVVSCKTKMEHVRDANTPYNTHTHREQAGECIEPISLQLVFPPPRHAGGRKFAPLTLGPE